MPNILLPIAKCNASTSNLQFKKKISFVVKIISLKVQKYPIISQTNVVTIFIRLQWNVLVANESVSWDIKLSTLYYRHHLTDTSIFINVYSAQVFPNLCFLNTLRSNRSTYFHNEIHKYKVRQVGSSWEWINLKVKTMQIYQNTQSTPSTFKTLLSHNTSDVKTLPGGAVKAPTIHLRASCSLPHVFSCLT